MELNIIFSVTIYGENMFLIFVLSIKFGFDRDILKNNLLVFKLQRPKTYFPPTVNIQIIKIIYNYSNYVLNNSINISSVKSNVYY